MHGVFSDQVNEELPAIFLGQIREFIIGVEFFGKDCPLEKMSIELPETHGRTSLVNEKTNVGERGLSQGFADWTNLVIDDLFCL